LAYIFLVDICEQFLLIVGLNVDILPERPAENANRVPPFWKNTSRVTLVSSVM